MKRRYEEPKAEKIEFNYQETVVASSTGSLKEGSDINGCYKGANASKPDQCTPQY